MKSMGRLEYAGAPHGVGYYLELLWVLAVKEIKVRYKHSVLGYVWSIANPLAFAMVFYFAFGIMMQVKVENYVVTLLAGLFPWQWFSNGVMGSTTIFLRNGELIKKISFPRNILVIAVNLQDMFHFVLTIPVIALVLMIYGMQASVSWLLGVPLLLIVQSLYVYGVGLLLGSVNVYFRDIEQITSIFLMWIFYMTPILYPVSMVPEQYRSLLYLNPLAPLINAWRELFLSGHIVWSDLSISAIYGLLCVGLGTLVYRRIGASFAEAL